MNSSTDKISDLKSEIEKHQNHYRIPSSLIYGALGILVFLLICLGIYFSSNSNQIKLTITNGSEIIKRLEVRAENAENAQVQDRDSIQSLKTEIVDRDSSILKLKTENSVKDKNIKELNDKVDSLLNVVNTYQRSDIEPVKRN